MKKTPPEKKQTIKWYWNDFSKEKCLLWIDSKKSDDEKNLLH